jgi:parallel beta-helix repeat protein
MLNSSNGKLSMVVMDISMGIIWTDAKNLAEESGGYLVTINSQEENDFVFNLINEAIYWNSSCGPLLGGIQLPGSVEPDGGWQWVTGEPLVYDNWRYDQPNNLNGAEDIIHFGWGGGITDTWNDLPHDFTTTPAVAFIVESSDRMIYADNSADGNNDGTSWTDAFTSLQDALLAASYGDEILIAQGIYFPDIGVGITQNDRTVSFNLKHGVVVQGGYAGNSGADPDERDIEVYETVLSGDLLGNDGPNFANNGDNSYHVVTGSGCDETAVVDGVTITAGNAGENQNVPRGCGGGMYNQYGSPTVTNCTFSRNFSGWDGGGMYNRDSSAPTVTNCTFIGNSSLNGGGMYHRGNSNSTITNCTFIGNSATDEGGGMTNYESSSPTLTNCTFNNNSAADKGAGMYNLWQSSPTLTNCTFSGNSANDGSGMYNHESSSPTLTNCTFRWNSASEEGGGMTNYDSSRPTLTNCTFSNNSAELRAGGMYNLWQSSPTLTNCTFSGNSADAGGGMYNYDNSSSTLANCILWGNTPIGSQIHYDGTSSATVSCSDVQGGWPGTDNIDADPCFADPGNDDCHLRSQAGRWDPDSQTWVQDTVTSSCIDYGDSGSDWTAELWPHGQRINVASRQYCRLKS